jgi:kynurenine formamidase
MTAQLNIDGREYRFDPTPIDISIPLRFNGPQPNAYGVETASSEPCVAGDLIGDTRRGGSCNFEQYTLIPHCNGTHTECVGHIANERISITDCLREALTSARLITVDPARGSDTAETYSMAVEETDRVITRTLIESGLSSGMKSRALVIRTLANDQRKLTRRYDEPVPAYFTTEAMTYIVELGFRHLLVDLPSIDRLYDEGRLSNHRVFWNVEQGSFETTPETRREHTITELIYVPNDVEDGRYLLNLQIAPFHADASPSRPLLFRLTEN